MKIDIEGYKKLIGDLGADRFRPGKTIPTELRMYPSGHAEDKHGISVYYAPFDDVNRDAKIVLLGITPGTAQMYRADPAHH